MDVHRPSSTSNSSCSCDVLAAVFLCPLTRPNVLLTCYSHCPSAPPSPNTRLTCWLTLVNYSHTPNFWMISHPCVSQRPSLTHSLTQSLTRSPASLCLSAGRDLVTLGHPVLALFSVCWHCKRNLKFAHLSFTHYALFYPCAAISVTSCDSVSNLLRERSWF